MKLFHISDLHIGRQLYQYSLAECQRAVLKQITELTVQEQPDVLIIAGDIFDRSVPSGEAYTILDEFLSELTDRMEQLVILIIAGNHDSTERLRYASHFLQKHRIHISVLPPMEEEEHLQKISLTDAWGPVHFYLLPFTRPSYVRPLLSGQEFTRGMSWNDAVAALLEREEIDYRERNVVVSHQFYGSVGLLPQTCDSERAALSVGGTDLVDVELLKDFDYAALGHLHGGQKVRYPHVRYSGTPFKYSVSEEHQKKAVVQVVLEEKGKPAQISLLPLTGPKDVYSMKGTLQEVIQAKKALCEDYVSITLTDEDDGLLTDAKDVLKERYRNILEIRVDNQRTRSQFEKQCTAQESWSLSEAFTHFFEEMNHRDMNPQEAAVMESVWKDMGEKDETD